MSSSRLARARHRAAPLVSLVAAAVTACSGDASGISAPIGAGTTVSGPAAIGPVPAANPFASATFPVDANSNARRTATAWRATRPADAALMDKIAAQPQVRWFGDWNTNVRADVDAAASASAQSGALPVFVAYNIPQRDCGGLSGGNSSTSADAYRAWIAAFAAGLGSRRAVVILEPDALASMDCLSSSAQQERLALFRYAVDALSASGTVAVYLDGGNPRWRSAEAMAQRLADAGVAATRGFALNVSNFLSTGENVAYGTALSALTGGKHFVIDTGRNGAGGSADWCNPAGQALGERPSSAPGIALVDAFLWVKAPGESDGVCNGGTASGTWMPEYALGLAARAGW